jgi:predicted alpha/beta hydrolase family esterase
MKTGIIVHGMEDSKELYYDPTGPSASNSHWLPWIQHQLIISDIVAQTPEMPASYNPEYTTWKKVFEGFSLDQDTVLIGHSCGAGFIVRYLSEENVQVGKVVLVAPWIDPKKSLSTGMFDFNINTHIVLKTKGITIFNSMNDMEEVQESVKEIIAKTHDIKLVNFENKGHFCFDDTRTIAFPELLVEAMGV